MANPLGIHMQDVDCLLEYDGRYSYHGGDQYLDTATSSGTTSPMPSTYEMPMMPDLSSLSQNPYPSPRSSRRETASPQPASHHKLALGGREDDHAAAAQTQATQPPKRKRENRYKNAPPSVLSRRRAQNRASQRAYRERKDQRIKDLETMLSEQRQKNESLSQAYTTLHADYVKLRTSPVPSQQPQQHPQSVPVYNNTPAIGGVVGNVGMPFASENMFMYPGMQGYSL